MEVAGDDPQLRAQLKDVPSVVAKNANWRRTVGRRERALVMGQQADQDRLAGAVGTEDGGVLTVVDGQREADPELDGRP